MAFVLQAVVEAGKKASLSLPSFPPDEDHSADARALAAAQAAATALSAVFGADVQVVASGDERGLTVSVAVLPAIS